MAIGFPSYSEKTVKFKGTSRKALARAAFDALDDLGWSPREEDKWFLRASVPFHLYIIFVIFGTKFTVEIEEGKLFLRSEGAIPIEWLDVGQHNDNIKRFLDRFDEFLEDEK